MKKIELTKMHNEEAFQLLEEPITGVTFTYVADVAALQATRQCQDVHAKLNFDRKGWPQEWIDHPERGTEEVFLKSRYWRATIDCDFDRILTVSVYRTLMGRILAKISRKFDAQLNDYEESVFYWVKNTIWNMGLTQEARDAAAKREAEAN